MQAHASSGRRLRFLRIVRQKAGERGSGGRTGTDRIGKARPNTGAADGPQALHERRILFLRTFFATVDARLEVILLRPASWFHIETVS